jgi:DNA-binding transcriptional regulator GbsR (MarR family)
MAQIHALLMVSANPMCADDVMAELNISRGNANMNLRELINWRLVDRVIVPGERKEYFTAEKDIWEVARIIVKERKKRELEPMLKFLESISEVQEGGTDADRAAFQETVNGIRKFGKHADQSLDNLIKADENWFLGTLLKLFK